MSDEKLAKMTMMALLSDATTIRMMDLAKVLDGDKQFTEEEREEVKQLKSMLLAKKAKDL